MRNTMKPLFIGYVGFYDDNMKPVAMASEHDDCFSKTLQAITQLGLLRNSQMGVQARGEVSDDEFAQMENAFSLAMEKTLSKNIKHEVA